MDLNQLSERSRVIWDTGDYAPTSRGLAPVSEALVEALGIGSDQEVLDVAAGHGNCAVAAARRGAAVTATDFAPGMIAAGRRRTEGEGWAITWQQADATALPFEDGSFDRVTSVFGAIFAPDQARAAAEAARVTRPGGRVGFTAWTEGSYAARLLDAMGRHTPRPAGAPDTLDWGRPDRVAALFEPTGCSLDVRRRTFMFRYGSWEEWRSGMEAHGMAVVARQSMAADRYEAMLDEMRTVTAEADVGQDGAVVVEAEYLQILATRR